MRKLKISPAILFFKKVKFTQFCWEWTASKNDRGYGNFQVNGKFIKAHRFSYELFKGKISDGLTIDHLCRNRGCVNPGHLEAVTQKINNLRGNCFSGINARKSICINGHSLEKDNVYIYNGSRHCKTCVFIRNKNYVNKKRITSSVQSV